MIKNHDPNHNFCSFAGTAMLILGSAVLVIYSAALAWQFYAANTSADSLGFWGNIGLASLHAFRLVTLDHAALLSVVHRILVLCSALIVTLIGMALLPKRTTGATAHGRRGVSAPPRGDQ
jgi:uncharacterized membrane protein